MENEKNDNNTCLNETDSQITDSLNVRTVVEIVPDDVPAKLRDRKVWVLWNYEDNPVVERKRSIHIHPMDLMLNLTILIHGVI